MIPVIIPAYEPDDKLITLLENINNANIKPVVVVNDGSVGEGTKEIFEKASSFSFVTVLNHAVNQGKGRALKTAFNYCLNEYPDMTGCITIDSDGQHSLEDMLKCMDAMKKNEEALVLGCRDFNANDVPARSSFGNKTTSIVMKALVGLSISDTQTGLRGISTKFMKHLLNVKGERYEFETNMLLETKELSIPIVEVPIKTIYIEENKASHFNPLKDSIKIYMLFGKFIFSSLSSCVIDLILFSIFCNLLIKLPDRGIITYITVSTVLARIISGTYNYAINYKVVFKSESGVLKTLPKYIILFICQMCLSAIFVNILYPLLGGAEVVVKMFVDVILFFISYFIQRELVYKKV